jgi:hypothetical protein
MSLCKAGRETAARRSDSPRAAELLAHARHVGELDRIIGHELAEASQQTDAASVSMPGRGACKPPSSRRWRAHGRWPGRCAASGRP